MRQGHTSYRVDSISGHTLKGRATLAKDRIHGMAQESAGSLLRDEEISTGTVSRSETVARRIAQEIADGDLRPGHHLGTKETLRQRFSVAVGTVNEAVRVLETQGVVNVKPGPGGGIFVSRQSPSIRLGRATITVNASSVQSIQEALAVRGALELLLCHDAGVHRTKADIRQFRQCLIRMDAARDREYMRATWDLHRAIAGAAGNQILRQIYVELLGMTERALEDVVPDPDVMSRKNRDHHDLVEAIVSRDAAAIDAAVAQHDPTQMLPKPTA